MLLILTATSKATAKERTLHAVEEALEKKNIPHTTSYLDSVLVFLTNEEIYIQIDNKPLSAFSHIYLRRVADMKLLAQIIASEAKNIGISVIDSIHTQPIRSSTKLARCYVFARQKISFPKTIFSPKYSDADIRFAIQKLRFPIIIKEFHSSQGAGVFIAKTKKDLQTIINKIQRTRILFILQEYIPNDFDYRILVLGKKAGIAEKKTRIKKKEYRNNVSLGAKEEFLDLKKIDSDILHIAERAAKATNIDIAGVDVVTDKTNNMHYILEINNSPQFSLDEPLSTEIEEVSQYIATWAKKSHPSQRFRKFLHTLLVKKTKRDAALKEDL